MQFLGSNLENARAIHVKASPLNWATPQSPAVLAIHGKKDTSVPFEQAQLLVERAQERRRLSRAIGDGRADTLQPVAMPP